MAEDLYIPQGLSKKEKYEALMPQIESLIAGETNTYANLANISAALKETFGFFWVGFYLVDSPLELVLGPFQGPVACTRIPKSKGVCGACWRENKTLIVPDVDKFPGHIACSSASKSEIVIPFSKNDTVYMVLDIDSSTLDDFDDIDRDYLEQLRKWI